MTRQRATRNTIPSIVEAASQSRRVAVALSHAERIVHARDQAERVERSLGKSDVQRNAYMKRRRESHEETKHAGK
jgi:hypothetical protein